jgi:malate:Na+ symporter
MSRQLPPWWGTFSPLSAPAFWRAWGRRPALSGNGMLIRSHEDNSVFAQNQVRSPPISS